MKEKGKVLDKLDAGMEPTAAGNFFNASEFAILIEILALMWDKHFPNLEGVKWIQTDIQNK